MKFISKHKSIPEVEKALIQEICDKFDLSENIRQIIYNRGYNTKKKIEDFICGDMTLLRDPFLLKGMKDAVARIMDAIQTKEHITIYGDYDVDGITSTTVLVLFLRSLHAIVDFYIPNRHNEGYGLHQEAIQLLANKGTDLIITVDCGITAINEVVYAKKINIDMIITDHHECSENLPAAVACINPKISKQDYPFRDLAGVGVTGKLVQALGGNQAISSYLDLIAIGTIADIVPLIDENRIMVKYGLQILNESIRPGLKALFEVSSLKDKLIEASHVAFGIAPRLNAGGRLGDSHRCVALLISEDINAVKLIANELNEENSKRRSIENNILKEAQTLIETEIDLAADKIIILFGQDWHQGVIGIVASRLVERYYRPVILMCMDGDYVRGSGRSIPDINLYDILDKNKDLFIRFGGHSQAAGITCTFAKITEIKKRLNIYIKSHYSMQLFIQKIKYDDEILIDNININLINQLELLKPFGAGNPTPSFHINNIFLKNKKNMGKNCEHMKVDIVSGKTKIEGVYFNVTPSLRLPQEDVKYELIVVPEINKWNSVTKVQCNVKKGKHILTIENIEMLLKADIEKVFGAFYQQIIYNKYEYLYSLDNIEIAKDMSSNDQYILDCLTRDIQGTMILVQTYTGFITLLNHLQDHFLLDQIEIVSDSSSSDPYGYNCIVLLSNIQEINFLNYKTIILYDGVLSNNYLKNIASLASPQKVILFWSKREIANLELTLKRHMLDRNDLVFIFNQLKAFLTSQNSCTVVEVYRYFANRSSEQIEYFKIHVAIDIFIELEFIVLYEENPTVIHLVSSPKNRKLDDSHIYHTLINHITYLENLNIQFMQYSNKEKMQK